MITVVNASFYGGDKNIPSIVNQPLFDGVEYILFTNKPEVVEGTNWKCIEYQTDNPRLSARDIKINIHKHLPDSDYWFWLDSNMEIKVDPNILVEKYLNQHKVCLMPHPERNHWLQEAMFLSEVNKPLVPSLQELINKLYEDNYVSTTLYETGVMLRTNCPEIHKMNNIWWEYVSEVCIRDQLSFPYSAWKTGLAVNTFPGTNSVNPLRYQAKPWMKQWDEVIRKWN